VLVVGLSPLTELYIRALDEFAPGQISIVGIVAEGEQLKGRRMHSLEVLGTPQEIEQVLAVQSVHGVEISRIIVTLPFEKFSKRSQKALLATERASNIKLDFFAERLGLINPGDDAPGSAGEPAGGGESASEDTLDLSRDLSRLGKHDFAALGLYSYLKRVIDIVGAALLFVCLLPLIALVALGVLLDVGLPLTFPQQRPGRLGHPFRLYKFRTMRAAHDEKGRRIPDQNRESAIGRFIRRWRLDEFPQLYNIIKGEMSFVGPRPLLPVDQPDGDTSRLLMRPGLTGWAQINGGREISIPDKNALDLWYLVHASLWLDVKIMLATFATLLRGERNNRQAIARAWEAIRQLEARVGAAAVQESVKNMQEDTA
jgi:lipopolysaccharide/colanic/teichoic acid biosynthesis glycosyltransferase